MNAIINNAIRDNKENLCFKDNPLECFLIIFK